MLQRIADQIILKVLYHWHLISGQMAEIKGLLAYTRDSHTVFHVQYWYG